jgi:hypothetical protein
MRRGVMRRSTHERASRTGRRGEEERLVDLLAEQFEEDQDEPDSGRLYPLRLLQTDDDVLADTSYDRGGWSPEECAMHLVEDQ